MSATNYPRPTKLLTTFIVICIVLAIPCTLFVSFLLAQEFGQASVKACCCLDNHQGALK
jgi:hypothetical protein